MEISQLRTFYEIAQAGSYTKASQKLFISKSAVSHQIKNLEKDLDVKLFQRQGNRRILTDDGISFAKAVSKFLDELDGLKRFCEDMRDSKTGAITIATSSGLMLHTIPEILQRFTSEFPHTRVKFMSRGASSELVEMVRGNAADLAIGTASTPDLPAEVCFLAWREFPRMLIARKNHPLSGRKVIRLADISSLSLILPKHETLTTQVIEKSLQQRGLPCDIIIEADSVEISKKYVQMGFGVAVAPDLSLTREEKESLWCHDVSRLFGKARYGIYYRRDKYFTTAMKQFIRVFSTKVYEDFLSQR